MELRRLRSLCVLGLIASIAGCSGVDAPDPEGRVATVVEATVVVTVSDDIDGAAAGDDRESRTERGKPPTHGATDLLVLRDTRRGTLAACSST